MVKDVIGYRFSPTGEEVINHYLKNKILGKTWLTDEAIGEINILSYIPKLLPRYAKIRSDDLYWYFFNRIEYLNKNNGAMKRSTGSGYWKPTGKDRQIRDKRGNGDEIGFKKTLVYHEGKVPNGVKTPWTMHEYHITSLPQNQRTFVVCQVKYKGDPKDISYGDNSTETGQPEFQVDQLDQQDDGLSMKDLSIPFNEQEDLSEWDPTMLFWNVLQQNPYLTQEDNQFLSELPPAYRETAQALLSDQEMPETTDYDGAINTISEFVQPSQEELLGLSVDELRVQIPENDNPFLLYSFEPLSLLSDYNHSSVSSELIPQENHNKHRPKKPLTGYIDCSSDSDTDDDAENHNKHRPKIRFIYCSSDSDIDESESISEMIYKGSSSSVNSVASSDKNFRKDLQTSADSSTRNAPEDQLTRRSISSEPEAKQDTSRAVDASLEEKSSEKKGLGFITEEESIERNGKTPHYVYLMNTIVAFIILMVHIRNIISVILTVQA